VVETSAQRDMDVERVGRVYFGLGEVLRLKWLREQLELLPVKGQWHAHARALLRDELFSQQNLLVEAVLRSADSGEDALSKWQRKHESDINRVVKMMEDMVNLPTMDYATVSVAIRSLGQIARSNSRQK